MRKYFSLPVMLGVIIGLTTMGILGGLSACEADLKLESAPENDAPDTTAAHDTSHGNDMVDLGRVYHDPNPGIRDIFAVEDTRRGVVCYLMSGSQFSCVKVR